MTRKHQSTFSLQRRVLWMFPLLGGAVLLQTSLAAGPTGKSAPAGSCLIRAPYLYCIEFDTGFTEGAARAECLDLKGSFQALACPRAERQGACVVAEPHRRRSAWLKYYRKTWQERSYRKTVSACRKRARAGQYVSRWVKADPDDSRVPAFDPASQSSFVPLGGLKLGTRVLAPRPNERFLFPAAIFSVTATNPDCTFVRFPDYRTELLFKDTPVLLLDWEVGSRVSCPRVAGGPLYEGLLETMDGPVWKLKTDRESLFVLAKYCRDSRPAAQSARKNVFCAKKPG